MSNRLHCIYKKMYIVLFMSIIAINKINRRNGGERCNFSSYCIAHLNEFIF